MTWKWCLVHWRFDPHVPCFNCFNHETWCPLIESHRNSWIFIDDPRATARRVIQSTLDVSNMSWNHVSAIWVMVFHMTCPLLIELAKGTLRGYHKPAACSFMPVSGLRCVRTNHGVVGEESYPDLFWCMWNFTLHAFESYMSTMPDPVLRGDV